MKPNKSFININTGSVGEYDDWWYYDENGNSVNAVDKGEVEEFDPGYSWADERPRSAIRGCMGPFLVDGWA